MRTSRKVLQVLFVFWVLFGAVAIVAGLAQRALVRRLGAAPATVRVADLAADDHRVAVVNGVFVVLLAVTGVAFIVWFRLAYRRATALGATFRHGPGWAVGGWFVPLANFVIPKQIADDMWASVVTSSDAVPGARRTRPRLVDAWWGTWVGGTALAIILQHSKASVSSPGGAAWLNTGYLVRDGLLIVAAVLALLVVRRIDAGLRTSEGVSLGEAAPSRSAGSRAAAGALAAGAAVLAVTVLVAAVLVDRHDFTSTRAVSGASRTASASDKTDTPTGFVRYASRPDRFALAVPEGWTVAGQAALTAAEAGAPIRFQASDSDSAIVSVFTYAGVGGIEDAAGQLLAMMKRELAVQGSIQHRHSDVVAGAARAYEFKANASQESDQARVVSVRINLVVGDRVAYVLMEVTSPGQATAHRVQFAAIERSFQLTR